MAWRALAVGIAVWVTACGGNYAPGERQAVAVGGSRGAAMSAAGGSSGGSIGHPAGGSPVAASGGQIGAAGEAGAGGAQAGDGGEPSVEAGAGGAVEVAGSGAVGSSGGSTGAAFGGVGGMSIGDSPGAGGPWMPPDPDCKPSGDHPLPLKCMPPQPIDCRLPVPGGDAVCVGSYGECPQSNPSGQYCHPDDSHDYSLCPIPSGNKELLGTFLKQCPKGTCGTAAGFACNQTAPIDGKYQYCPCVQSGVVAPYPCGENGTTCPPGVSP